MATAAKNSRDVVSVPVLAHQQKKQQSNKKQQTHTAAA
jgi:hypothetical protein